MPSKDTGALKLLIIKFYNNNYNNNNNNNNYNNYNNYNNNYYYSCVLRFLLHKHNIQRLLFNTL